ncbi:MAG TPA: hypothetical protein VH000_03130 [Rhizomicrobium sp.]|nr:hypothetical protein [Rhizomicrobium sp.]
MPPNTSRIRENKEETTSKSDADKRREALEERLASAKTAMHEPVDAFGQVRNLEVPGRDTSAESEPAPRAETPAGDTESLLNSLIAECHYLMREVAFRSMCQTHDARDRVRFMSSAMEFATTGAKVAEAIVHLRNGQVPVEVRRSHHTMTLERAGEGGGGTARS